MQQKINTKFLDRIKLYRKRFLTKKYQNLDESATRLMVNHFLTEILGYIQLDDIKTEYAIKGTYADYVIQIEKKKHIVVEVKSIQIDLAEAHLRQALSYAANEGIDWILLTNGRQFAAYKVIFGKPVTTKLLFTTNLLDIAEIKKSAECFELLTKKSILTGKLEQYWKRFAILESSNFAKLLFHEDTIKTLRKIVTKKTGIKFDENEISDAIYKVVLFPLQIVKPKSVKAISKKEKKLTETISQ